MCYPCHHTLPQLLQFSVLMNLYFVRVINIRFICDGEIYLLTYQHLKRLRRRKKLKKRRKKRPKKRGIKRTIIALENLTGLLRIVASLIKNGQRKLLASSQSKKTPILFFVQFVHRKLVVPIKLLVMLSGTVKQLVILSLKMK